MARRSPASIRTARSLGYEASTVSTTRRSRCWRWADMAESAGSLHVQQLLELLAVVTSPSDEQTAVRGAVERAAQALEAEVAAVAFDDRVEAAVGFPVGRVPGV